MPLPSRTRPNLGLSAAFERDFSLAFSTTPFYIRGAMTADDRKIPEDPTPLVAAPTDVAPLTQSTPKPPHERTADEEAGVIDWKKLAASERFRNLLKAKQRFIVP